MIVLDHSGHWLPYPLRGDTETGIVVQQVRDSDGCPVFSHGQPVTEKVVYDAPLTVRANVGERSVAALKQENMAKPKSKWI
jgi:hypothetical protein